VADKIWIFDERAGRFRLVKVERCKTCKSCPPDQIKFYWHKDKWYYAYYGTTLKAAWIRATRHLFNRIDKLKAEIKTNEYLIQTTYGPEPEGPNG
jgi:hypothetical protein